MIHNERPILLQLVLPRLPCFFYNLNSCVTRAVPTSNPTPLCAIPILWLEPSSISSNSHHTNATKVIRQPIQIYTLSLGNKHHHNNRCIYPFPKNHPNANEHHAQNSMVKVSSYYFPPTLPHPNPLLQTDFPRRL